MGGPWMGGSMDGGRCSVSAGGHGRGRGVGAGMKGLGAVWPGKVRAERLRRSAAPQGWMGGSMDGGVHGWGGPWMGGSMDGGRCSVSAGGHGRGRGVGAGMKRLGAVWPGKVRAERLRRSAAPQGWMGGSMDGGSCMDGGRCSVSAGGHGRGRGVGAGMKRLGAVWPGKVRAERLRRSAAPQGWMGGSMDGRVHGWGALLRQRRWAWKGARGWGRDEGAWCSLAWEGAGGAAATERSPPGRDEKIHRWEGPWMGGSMDGGRCSEGGRRPPAVRDQSPWIRGLAGGLGPGSRGCGADSSSSSQ
jgi:hypothetical protein